MSERLLRLVPSTVNFQVLPSGHSKLRPTDIAMACAGWPDWLFDLLMATFAGGSPAQRQDRALSVCQALISQGYSMESVAEAVEAFIHPPHCPDCHGTGRVPSIRKGYTKQCKACDATGHSVRPFRSNGGQVYQYLHACACDALSNMRDKLAV